MNEETKKITQRVGETIKKEKIQPRSRWYFLLRVILFYIALGILFFVSFFIVSFIEILIREFALVDFPSFGVSGFTGLLVVFPWHLVISLVVLVWIALLIFVKNLGKGYRIPYFFLVGGMLFVIVLGGALAIRIPSYASIFYKNDPDAYPQIRTEALFWELPSSWAIGQITAIENDFMELRVSPSSKRVVFKISAELEEGLEMGDRVLLQYVEENGSLEITQIKKIDSAYGFSRSK